MSIQLEVLRDLTMVKVAASRSSQYLQYSIPRAIERLVNDEGWLLCRYPITIWRRYRGFTSLWPWRDSKVSTPLLRTRQNGVHVHRVFRIVALTTAHFIVLYSG